MADNTTLNAGAGGDVISTDQITTLNGGAIATGEKAQRIKAGWGVDGTFNDVTATQPLPSVALSNALVSVGNSTAINLAANATFTGTSEDVSDYSTIVVTNLSSHAGASIGFLFQFSADGVNWDTFDSYSINLSNTVRTFSFPVSEKFFRVAYTNGVTLTTTFRIQTIYSKHEKQPLAKKSQDSRGNEFAVTDVLAHLAGYDLSTDSWNRIRATTTGAVRVAGASIFSTSGSVAAAATGTIGPFNVSEAGNVTFIAKNQTAANAWGGAPVLVFEQSDDQVSWSPLTVIRSDNNSANSTHTLGANAGNIEVIFDAAVEAISYVRCRVTTGPTTNTMTVVINAGSFPFNPIVSTIDRKDAGRVPKTINLDSFAIAATTETLHTLSFSSANGTASAGTSYSVTAGKTFRVQSVVITLHTIAGNTTAVNVIVRLRANNAGAAIVSSPIQLVTALQGIAAANSAAPPVNIQIPDGWEFPGGAGIGITSICAGFVATTAAPKLDITLIGYEY